MKKEILLQVIGKTLWGLLSLFFSGNLSAQNPHGIIIIKIGAVLSIGKNATLVTNTDFDNAGTLKNEGSIIFNGNTLQAFPGTTASIFSMNILEVKNTGAGIALNKSITIAKELKLTVGNLALGNNDITIQSNATQTAAVSAIAVGAGVSYGTGRFIIERYIKVGTGGHGKSWQFLAVPANGQTIRNTWQEAGVAANGYGTWVTNPLGAGAGYDATSPNASIKTYQSATNNYDQGPASTSALIDNPKGYMLFVRGDRTVTSGSGTTPTTLRIKGTLFTPANPPSPITVAVGKFESVGNPYASQIDFTLLTRSGLDNTFYTWDPSLVGSYGVGGYQTMTATNSWNAVPGGGMYTGVHKTIESGQAFFVHSTASLGTIGFSEQVKTGGSKLVNRNATEARITANRQFLRSTLLTNTGTISDGNAAAFDNDLSNEVDGDDALKIMNGGENFGLKRGNHNLAVEGRSLITTTDTLFYFVSNLVQQPHTIVIAPDNMDLTKQAFLVDNFLQTQTPISLSDSSFINFNVTSDPLSYKSDRFMVIFRPQTVLAVTSTTLNAIRNDDASITLNWKTIAENNIREYVVERSANAISFNAIKMQTAMLNNGAESNYSFKDLSALEGTVFYRIKITALSGAVTYSNVVKMTGLKTGAGVSVYPNPVTAKLMNVYFTSPSFGNYNISLVNTAGQQIWTGKILYNNNSGNKITVELPENIAAGKYYLSLSGKDGKSFKTVVMVL